MGLFPLSRRTPMVTVDEIPTGQHRTAAERNVRVPVGVYPQEAPDPVRQGAIPSRRAAIQVVTFAMDMNSSMDERFQAPNIILDPIAARPRGHLTPEVMRQNVNVRNHVAYGSLFTYDPQIYGVR